jgi:YfiH family protein
MTQPISNPIQAACLDRIIGLKHGFFGRQGGVSTDPYESLNCSTSSGDHEGSKAAPDSVENVTENRIRACSNLGILLGGLVTMRQVHGNVTRIITTPPDDDKTHELREADALVTAKLGVALGLLTADCAPVLLVDDNAGVIGAAHAGWRGALGGILGSVVGAMETLGAKPQRITAVIGPAIGPRSYKVGPEFPALFQAQDPANDAFFSNASGQLRFNLPGYVAAQLQNHGVRAFDLGHDTFAEDIKFFSYRRAMKNSKTGTPGETGRQLSVICLG